MSGRRATLRSRGGVCSRAASRGTPGLPNGNATATANQNATVGGIRIDLVDIELLTIKIRLLVASVDRAREMGIDWWEHDLTLSSQQRDVVEGNRRLRRRIGELERGGGRDRDPDRDGVRARERDRDLDLDRDRDQDRGRDRDPEPARTNDADRHVGEEEP